MGIKRGVSLYSYQQEQFFKRMTLRDMIKEVHDNLKTDGIEIIDQAVIRDYPFPSEEFIAEFRDLMAEFNMHAVTMDVYLDTLQYRDHVMTHKEAAERLIRDLKLAARLGFDNVRCLAGVPLDVIEMAIPTAEEVGVRIGKEIHNPLSILSDDGKAYGKGGPFPRNPRMCEEIIELAERKNTKYVGLVPDFGIFQYKKSTTSFAYDVRHGANPDALRMADRIAQMGIRDIEAAAEMLRSLESFTEEEIRKAAGSVFLSTAKSQDIATVVPYIVSIHGKFYQMTEVPGLEGKGVYEDQAIDYWNPIYHLTKAGYNGYINSEFEGQRDQQDRGREYLCDEVEEVRRHHKMMARYIEMARQRIDA